MDESGASRDFSPCAHRNYHNGVFGMIPDSVVLIRGGEEGTVYLVRPISQLTVEQEQILTLWLQANGNPDLSVLPSDADIGTIVLSTDLATSGPQAHVQSTVATLSHSVEFVDDLNTNFETLKRYYGLESDEDIKKLIRRFGISYNFSVPDGTIVSTTLSQVVEEKKYKTALFLYWLSGTNDAFPMNEERRNLVRAYFGTSICNSLDAHPSVKALLQEPPEGMTEEEAPVLVNLLKVR